MIEGGAREIRDEHSLRITIYGFSSSDKKGEKGANKVVVTSRDYGSSEGERLEPANPQIGMEGGGRNTMGRAQISS